MGLGPGSREEEAMGSGALDNQSPPYPVPSSIKALQALAGSSESTSGWLFRAQAWMQVPYDGRGFGFLQVCPQGRLDPSPQLSLKGDETESHITQAGLELMV